LGGRRTKLAAAGSAQEKPEKEVFWKIEDNLSTSVRGKPGQLP